MSLIACIECGSEVSTTAKACPKCGAKVPKTKWWLWIPLSLVVAFFVFPYIAYSPEERTAISARADCERVFPLERGRSCDRVYDEALRRMRPGGEAPVNQALVDATTKAHAAEEAAQRKECEQSISSRRSEYQRLMASREFWSASLALRRCSELLDDAVLKALVAEAEKKQYVMEIESSGTKREVRNQAIEALLRDYPDVGKKYAKLLKR